MCLDLEGKRGPKNKKNKKNNIKRTELEEKYRRRIEKNKLKTTTNKVNGRSEETD